MCVRFLAEKKCTQIGLFLVSAGSLPAPDRTVPSRSSLSRTTMVLDIRSRACLNQPTGAPGCNFSGDHASTHCVRFLSALRESRPTCFQSSPLPIFEGRLRAAHAEVLIDDLAVLEKFCAASAESERSGCRQRHSIDRISSGAGALFRVSLRRPTSPGKAGLEATLEGNCRSKRRLGRKDPGPHSPEVCFLRWLAEIASSFGGGTRSGRATILMPGCTSCPSPRPRDKSGRI